MNNELTLNVDEQQDDIKHLKEDLTEKALCVRGFFISKGSPQPPPLSQDTSFVQLD